eukprot:TRINITY_DN102114_c0_g1_i1.p1 TRINITY_DN102114_c0_g1~~TRINITY_DN102114_c0_g1_i1.p1  ORF type:complete len:2251 (+),score=371.14 TRINITY_DN102114_c0_g1_i1:506-6754(+)
MTRRIEGNFVVPVTACFPDPVRRVDQQEVVEQQEFGPISLEKRYKMTERHLQLLKEHGLKNVQLPNVLDVDQQPILERIMYEAIFLMGRSGSGKTTLQVHALYYLYEAEKDFGLQRPATAEEEDADDLPGPILLVTKSAQLASSIRKLFRQMCAGLATADLGAAAEEMDMSLGIGSDEAVHDELPPSFRKKDIKAGTSPLIASWVAVLLAADASFPEPTFFRHDLRGEDDVAKAIRLTGGPGGNRVLQVADRFQRGDEGHEIDGLVDYDFFEARVGPKVGSRGGLALLCIYKDIQTIIAGSLRAIRSPRGYLTRQEYITGRAEDGSIIVEAKQAAARSKEERDIVYDAFEVYRKLKREERKWDRMDPIRHLVQRARVFSRRRRCEDFRMLSAVFIDEVQDLLPAEILVLRLFCQHNNCWIFAGDTAQTISKGVEFRFEFLRTLYYEEFILNKDWVLEKTAPTQVYTCTECTEPITKPGGLLFECKSKHVVTICGSDRCYKSLEKRSQNAPKGADKGELERRDWCRGRGRMSCPQRACAWVMAESEIAVAEEHVESEDDVESVPHSYKEVPGIMHLTHNHRSARGVLDVAGSIIDLLVHLFPEKIDKLPRERSQVDAQVLPVFLSGMKFDEAIDIVFRRANPGAAQELEFGATQAVLVWSDEAKKAIKAQFQHSIVLTIFEVKGLEFHDVFIVNPFSDMCTSDPVHGTQLWRLLYRCMLDWDERSGSDRWTRLLDTSERYRALDFHPERHGLLCSWLKALYVAVTRARQRVWFFEEEEAAKPALAYWSAAGLVRPISSRAQAEAAPEFAEGFAVQSSLADILDQGKTFLRNQKYDEAIMLFQRAEKMADAGANLLRKFAQIEKERLAVRFAEDAKQQKVGQVGSKYFALAAELRQRPAENSGGLRYADLLKKASECFLEGQKFKDAAKAYELLEDFINAAKCYQQAKMWPQAGRAWVQAGRLEDALRAYFNGSCWPEFATEAANAARMSQPVLEEKVLRDLLRKACRHIAQLISGNTLTECRQDHYWPSFRSCLDSLPAGQPRNDVIRSLPVPGLYLEVLEEEGRFRDCAAYCLESLDFNGARDFYIRDGARDLANHFAIVSCLRAFGITATPGNLDRPALQRAVKKIQEYDLQDGPDAFNRDLLVKMVDDGRPPGADSADMWRLASSTMSGHSLRFRMMLFVLEARQLGSAASAPPPEQGLLGLRRRMLELQSALGSMAVALRRNMSSSSGPEQERSKSFVKEFLLVEEAAGSAVLVLAEALPRKDTGCKMSMQQALHLALEILSLLQFRVSYEFFECCKRFLWPCWSLHAHGKCLITGCDAYHGVTATGQQAAGNMTGILFQSWQLCKRTAEGVAFTHACEFFGERAFTFTGCKPYDTSSVGTRWSADTYGNPWQFAKATLTAEGLQLKEYLLTDYSASVPFNRMMGLPEIKDFLSLSMGVFLAMLQAKRKAPSFLDLLGEDSVLIFSPYIDYRGVADLLHLVSKTGDKAARGLLSSYAIAHRAAPEGRHAGAQPPDAQDFVLFVRTTAEAGWHLCRKWLDFNQTPDLFPVSPGMLVYMLQRCLVWSNISLTRFSNTTLPTSFVQKHLHAHPELAALAATTALNRDDRRAVINDMHSLVHMLGEMFKRPDQLKAWIQGHGCIYGAVISDLIVIAFSFGSINWIRHMRNSNIKRAVGAIKLDKRLDTMNMKGWFSGTSVPKRLQWLVVCCPTDSFVTTRSGDEVRFDQSTPWLHAAASDLRNPFLLLQRSDSSDAAASWTRSERPLEIHWDAHLPVDKREQYSRMLRERLDVDGYRDGLRWPPPQVQLRWEALQQVVVYAPGLGGSLGQCSFDGLGGQAAPVAQQSSEEDRFVLDKSCDGVHSGSGTAATLDAVAQEMLDAAERHAIQVKRLPLFITVRLLVGLKAARHRLKKATVDAKAVLWRSEKQWCEESWVEKHAQLIYMRTVAPIVWVCQEDAERLHNDVLRDTLNASLTQPIPGQESGLVLVDHPASDALDELEELKNLGDDFVRRYRRSTPVAGSLLKTKASAFWSQRRRITSALVRNLHRLDLAFHLLGTKLCDRLKAWRTRANARQRKLSRVS